MALGTLLGSYSLHITPLSADTILHVQERMVGVSAEIIQNNAAELYAIASTAVAECTAKAAQLAAGQWKSYVKTQLACGGGSLFRHISKQDKEHLNVDITDTGTVVKALDKHFACMTLPPGANYWHVW